MPHRSLKILFLLLLHGWVLPPMLGYSAELDPKNNWRVVGQPFSEHFDTINIALNPQNYRIKQDAKGYIYAANGSGILIYDGSRWQVLSSADQQAVHDFALAKDGRIYSGTSGDLGYFEANDRGQWQYHSVVQANTQIPEISSVYKVEQAGRFIVFLSSSHVFYYSPEKGLHWYEKKVSQADLLFQDDRLLVITEDNGLLIFDTRQTFSLLSQIPLADENSFKNTSNQHANFRFNFAKRLDQQPLVFNNQRLYWLTTNYRLKFFKTEIDDWLKQNKINDVIEISRQRLAIASATGGIAIINQSGQLVRFYNNQHGLPSNSVNALYLDRENNLWAASATNGIYRIELDSAISYFPSKDEFYLNASSVDFKGHVFMGAQHGLFLLQPAKTPLEQAKFKRVNPELLSVMSLVDSGTTLLIGHELGITELELDENQSIKLTTLQDGQNGQGTHIRKIIIDNKNPDIAFAISNSGLIKLQRNNGQWRSLGLLEQFNKRLFSLTQDTHGSLWVGTQTGLFFQINDTKQWPQVDVNPLDFPPPAPPGQASTFSLDDSVLFANGVGGLVNQLTDKNILLPANIVDWQEQEIVGLIDMVPVNRIPANELATNVLPPKEKQTWFLSWIEALSMDRVGKLIQKQSGKYEVDFSDLDRLKLEFTLGLYDNQQGTLWVNTKGKVVRYDSQKKIQKTSLFLPVVSQITEIGGNNQLIFNNTHFQQNYQAIELTADQNAIRIDFTAADYVHSKTTQFRFKLTGHSQSWSDWQTQPWINYTNLTPGKHFFQLQYRTTPSSISPLLSIRINHAPYWYQSLLGRSVITMLGLLLLFVAAWFIARERTKQLKQQANILESQVSDRTRMIEEKNIQLKEKSLQLEYKNLQLEQVDEAKNRFFTNISHEFRTPLSLAIGPLKDVINLGQINDPKTLDYLNISLRNNLHMMDLLSQVLDINKLEAGGMPVNIVKVNLAANLQYCIQRFQHVSEKHAVTFKTTGFEQQVLIYFDADHFERIILNLLSNAVKFSPPNSQINIVLSVDEQDIKICIVDQGAGISEKDLQHIFDRFYQGSQSSHTIQPGTGIGLSLVKELVTLHHGNIQAISELGKGTRFCLTILRGNEHYEGVEISEKVHSRPPFSEFNYQPENGSHLILETTEKKPTDESRQTLLIIDDNADLRHFIHNSLIGVYNILEADNGRIGLSIAQNEQPDLIVSDVMMPVMDGLQLANALKNDRQTAHIPLILLTAKSTKRDIVEGLQHGADDYLSKPFDNAELIARIAAQLAQKQRIADKLFANFFTDTENLEHPNNLHKPKADLENGLEYNPDIEETADFTKKINRLIVVRMRDEMFDVGQMSRGLNITRSTLFRQVKKTFSCTPNQLLKSYRLNAALIMLQKKNGSISEVAYAVGFQSLSVFSRAFSEQYKVPPSRFEDIESTQQ